MIKNILTLLAAISFLSAYVLPTTTPPNASFQKEWLTFLSLFLLLFSSCQLKWRTDEITLSLTGMFIIIAFQQLFGFYAFFSDALLPSLYIIAFITSYLYASQITNKHKALEAIFTILLIAACVSALMTIYRWQYPLEGYLFIDQQRGSRGYGNFGQPNHLATLTNWGIISTLFFLQHKRLSLLPALLITSLLCFTLILTNSRAGFLELIFICGAFFFLNKGNGKFQISALYIAALTVILFFTTPLLENLIHFNHINSTGELATAAQNNFNRGNTRLENWSNILFAIQQGGLFGYGWLQTSSAILTTLTLSSMHGEIFTYSHNIILDLAIWIGPLPCVIIIFLTLKWVYKHLITSLNPNKLFALLILITLGIHSLLEYPYAYAYFTIPAFFIAGLFVSEPTRSKTIKKQYFIPIILIPYGILLSLLLKEGLVLEKESQLARFQLQRYVGSFKIKPLSEDIILLDAYKERYRLGRLDTQNLDEKTLLELQQVSYRFPSGNLYFRYIVSLALNGNQEAARTEMQKLKLITRPDLYTLLDLLYEDIIKGNTTLPYVTPNH